MCTFVIVYFAIDSETNVVTRGRVFHEHEHPDFTKDEYEDMEDKVEKIVRMVKKDPKVDVAVQNTQLLASARE